MNYKLKGVIIYIATPIALSILTGWIISLFVTDEPTTVDVILFAISYLLGFQVVKSQIQRVEIISYMARETRNHRRKTQRNKITK